MIWWPFCFGTLAQNTIRLVFLAIYLLCKLDEAISLFSSFLIKTFIYYSLLIKLITRLGQLGANISPDRSSLTPQVLIGNFLKHNYPLLYELQHINLLCLYLPKEDGVSPDTEYITQIIFSIFLQ